MDILNKPFTILTKGVSEQGNDWVPSFVQLALVLKKQEIHIIWSRSSSSADQYLLVKWAGNSIPININPSHGSSDEFTIMADLPMII